MSKKTKHQRKLKKKADEIKRKAIAEGHDKKWHIEAILYRRKVKIIATKISPFGYPQQKQAVIGLKESLNFARFFGEFQGQKRKK
jgi:hypothetical protein